MQFGKVPEPGQMHDSGIGNRRFGDIDIRECRNAREGGEPLDLGAGDIAVFPIGWTGDGPAPERWVWNTHDAHNLLRWALAVAGPQAQCALKQALFEAHFQQRLNVSDRDVLLAVAEGVGLDRQAADEALDDPALAQAVRLEEQRAAENGIRSVPTYVVAGKYILQGSADPESYRQALIKLASMEAMA